MAAPQSSPLPEAPTRGEAEGQFVPKANAFVGALEPFRQQLQAQADFVNDRSTETEENAALAQDASEMALSSANFAGDWSGLSGAFDVPTSVLHDDTYWQLLEDVSNIQNAEPGVSAAWAPILVARNVVLALPDITALSSLNTSALVDGQQFSVGSYLPDTSTGSALLRWRPDLPKSRHDGVLFFSLTVPMFTGTDTTDYRNGVGEADSGGNGVMELVRGEIIYDASIRVPSQYPNPNEAIRDTHARILSCPDVEIEILFESGYLWDAGVFVENGNYGRYKLRSEDDATVFLSPSFAGIPTTTIPDRDSGSANNIIVGLAAVMPVLDMNVDADGHENGGGYVAANGSTGRILPGRGMVRVARHGCHAFGGSTINAFGSIFTDSGIDNFRASLMSDIDGQGATADRCGADGNCIHITRNSRGHFQEASAQDGAGRGVRCARSKLNLTNAVVKNNASTDIFYSEGSEVSAAGLETTNGFPAIQDFAGDGGTAFNSLTQAGYVTSNTGDATGRPGTIVGSNANGEWRVDPDGFAYIRRLISVDTSSPGTVQEFSFPLAGFSSAPTVWFGARGGADRPTSGANNTEKRRAYLCTVCGASSGSTSWEVVVDPAAIGVTGDLSDYNATLYAQGYVAVGELVTVD